MIKRPCFYLVLIGLFLLPAVSYSQTSAQQRVPDAVTRTQEQLQDAAEAAAQSKTRSPLEGRTVTFQEMLKHPDDPDLNAAYARTQIKNGDLLGAASTLERMLLTHPNALDVKLLYGFVLFRLDDALTAKSTLSSIDGSLLTAEQRAERDSVLAQIENRQKRLHQSFTLSVGGHWDLDRNAAPPGGQILVSDSLYTLQDRARVQKDYGFLMQAVYDADYDLGLDTKTSMFVTANGMRDQQITVHTLDTVAGGLEVGIRHEQGPWRLQTGIFTSQMRLMGEYFMNDYGIELKPVRRLDSEWDVAGDFRFERQAFHDVTADSTGTDNSGISAAGWLGPVWHVSQTQSVAFAGGLVRHDAAGSSYGKYQSSSRYGVRLNDTIILPKSQFILFSGEVGNVVYAQANTLISKLTRHDNDIRLGVAYGVPFSTIASALDSELNDMMGAIVLTLHGEYYREFSNLVNYSYSNMRADAVLSKRWEF